MRAYVGVTDGDWFRFLRDRPQLDEVNFWKPGSGSGHFRALDPGELFLFKLHASDGGAVVGGATFVCSSRFPAWVAWEAFGEKNGAVDFPQMRARIERYRREPIGQGEVEIGCLILREPFFFEQRDWIPAPRDWRPSTQQGKGYDLTSGVGRELWDAISDRWVRANASVEIPNDPSGPMFREALGRRRLGQGSFRLMVMDAYERRCAVTREKALPALQAAHIRPVAQGGQHQIANALLLRSDIHALYDHGYVTVTPKMEFRVSRRLHTDFDNGQHYVALEGTELWLPRSPDDLPNRDSLEWHADEIFLR